ncbi:MAG: transcriptional repressor LexA [Bdellovibrionales bacterium]
MKRPQSLTPKEKSTLEFIEEFISEQGFSPTFTEIKEYFGYASYNSVQRYLKQLEKKGYLHLPGGNQKRAIQVLLSSTSFQSNVLKLTPKTSKVNKKVSLPAATLSTQDSVLVPLLGDVAAGIPIEALRSDETISAPLSLVKEPHQTFALRVNGDSMIEDGIFSGDTVLVQTTHVANNGEIVVAVVDNEATIKRIYFHKNNPKGQIELRPSNSSMMSMWFSGSEVEIKGDSQVCSGSIDEFLALPFHLLKLIVIH